MIRLDGDVIVFHKKNVLFEKWELTTTQIDTISTLLNKATALKPKLGNKEFTLFLHDCKVIFNPFTRECKTYIKNQPTVFLQKEDINKVKQLLKELSNV
jgi:hypothetical protein